MKRLGTCCQCPVERHAYNGCADCSCCVPWTEHVDRLLDTSDDSHTADCIAHQRKRRRYRRLLRQRRRAARKAQR